MFDGGISGAALPPPTEGDSGSFQLAFLAGSPHDCVTPFNGPGLPASSVHALTSRRRRNQLSRLRRFNRASGYGFRGAMCSWHNDYSHNLPPPLLTRSPPGLEPYDNPCSSCTSLSAPPGTPALAHNRQSQREDNQPPGTPSTPNTHDLFTIATSFVTLHSARDASS